MDYIVGVISLVSLGLNYWIYRRLTATYPVGTVEETFDLQSTCVCGAHVGETCRPGCDPRPHDCCKVILEFLHTEEDPEPEKAPEPKKNSESYSAWVNRSGIPMVPQVKPPEPIVKAPNRGPLARPDGFV